MTTPRTLRKPPIREALIDFRIAVDSTIDADRLSTLRNVLADYPIVEEKRQFKAEVRVAKGEIAAPAVADLGFAGLFFRTADRSRLAQFRRDGFTLNQLDAYRNADDLVREGLRLWALYADVVKPVAVTRLAFRYINSLALPYRDGDSFERFLTAPPAGPPDPRLQNVSSFLSRVVCHEEDRVAVVTQKLETTISDSSTPVTLDIDVFVAREVEPHADALLPILEVLRSLKNRIFFALLTDEAVELYV